MCSANVIVAAANCSPNSYGALSTHSSPALPALPCLLQMPAEGSLSAWDHPRGLMILTEGGQLVVHDLQQWQPTPLTLPVQELPPITVARLVPTVSVALLQSDGREAGGSAAVSPRSGAGLGAGGGSALPSPSPRGGEASSSSPAGAAPAAPLPQHALTLDKVQACSRRFSRQPGGSAAESSLLDHWPFTGGQPACSLAGGGGGEPAGSASSAGRHPSALYFSGHRDGRVRVWDATTQVPELLLTIPAAAGQERLRAVTALEVGVPRVSGLSAGCHPISDTHADKASQPPTTLQSFLTTAAPLLLAPPRLLCRSAPSPALCWWGTRGATCGCTSSRKARRACTASIWMRLSSLMRTWGPRWVLLSDHCLFFPPAACFTAGACCSPPPPPFLR